MIVMRSESRSASESFPLSAARSFAAIFALTSSSFVASTRVEVEPFVLLLVGVDRRKRPHAGQPRWHVGMRADGGSALEDLGALRAGMRHALNAVATSNDVGALTTHLPSKTSSSVASMGPPERAVPTGRAVDRLRFCLSSTPIP